MPQWRMMIIAAIPVVMAANNKAVIRIKMIIMRITMMMKIMTRMIMMTMEARAEEGQEAAGETMGIHKVAGVI